MKKLLKKFDTKLKDLIEKDFLQKTNSIRAKKSLFSHLTLSLVGEVDTFFEKEPETIDWINNFEGDNVIF